MTSQFVIEVTFRYTAKGTIGMGPLLGKRVTYPLAKGTKAVMTVPSPADLGNELEQILGQEPKTQLLFWLGRTNSANQAHLKNANRYTLLFVHGAECFRSLRLDNQVPASSIFTQQDPLISLKEQSKLQEPLGGPDTTIKRLTALIEGPDGNRYPLDISAIGGVKDLQEAKQKFASVFLAVLTNENQKHRLLMVLPDGDHGESGNILGYICNQLQGNNEWVVKARAVCGCPPQA